MLKHYVEFLYPGLFCSEASVEEIAERDVNKVELPDNCFGFCFFDRTVTVIDGQTLTGDRKNVSGWYYQGETMTLEQVKAVFGNDSNYRILISNMESNGYNAVVRTKFDQFMPLEDNDTVL